MGCDIHMYIEHRKSAGSSTWWGFGGRINPGRYYDIFHRLAGVRGRTGEPPKYPPRGVPADAGMEVRWDNTLYVREIEDDHDEKAIARVRAESYVSSGASKWVDERKTVVTHPDWHSHSWLTADEMMEVASDLINRSPEYKAVIAAMRSLESDGHEVRAVFWFDN